MVPTKKLQKYIQIGDRVEEIHNVIVHRFKVGDVEDPDLYAAQPIITWQESEIGKWVMKHAAEQPMWHKHQHSYLMWGYQYAITAKLVGKDYTYWMLKYNNLVDTLD